MNIFCVLGGASLEGITQSEWVKKDWNIYLDLEEGINAAYI